MEDNKNKKLHLYHGRLPVTRREMLISGAIPMLTSIAAPTSLMTIFAQAGIAEAVELCKISEGAKFPAFININCAGGWGACVMNWVPLTEGRELAPHYGRNGMGSANNLAPMIVSQGHFKNKPNFYSGSGFLAGVQSSLVANLASAALAKTNFVGAPLQSQNDTQTNKLSAVTLLQKAGVNGSILPMFGQADTMTGVGQAPAFGNPSKAPLLVNDFNAIVNALGVGDRLAMLNQNQKTRLFKASQRLSEIQSRKLASLTGGSLLDRLLNLANADNTKLIENPSGLDLDPITNPQVAAVWGLNNNTAKNSRDYVNASSIYNVANSNSGACGIQVGGCDYHGATLAATIAKDNEIGTLAGRIIQTLHVLNKPGFITVTTDGSVGAPVSDIPGVDPTADRGDCSAVYMMYYDPTGQCEAPDSQLGHMKTEGEAADETFLVGGNPEIMTAAVIANFFSAAGKQEAWAAVPELNRTFDSLQLKKIFKFFGKAG